MTRRREVNAAFGTIDRGRPEQHTRGSEIPAPYEQEVQPW
jgi:hypothetical protein